MVNSCRHCILYLFQERTEEKRKIYRLAGGGTSVILPPRPLLSTATLSGKHSERGHINRASISLPETKKVDTSYLPAIEQKRREAWRARLAFDDDLHPENGVENGDAQTPPSEDSSPAVKKKRSLRNLLTPVLGERDVVPSLTPKKEEKIGFEVYNEEDDRRNLMRRWGQGDPRQKAKVRLWKTTS